MGLANAFVFLQIKLIPMAAIFSLQKQIRNEDNKLQNIWKDIFPLIIQLDFCKLVFIRFQNCEDCAF